MTRAVVLGSFVLVACASSRPPPPRPAPSPQPVVAAVTVADPAPALPPLVTSERPCERGAPRLPPEPIPVAVETRGSLAATRACAAVAAENTRVTGGRGDLTHLTASLWCAPTARGAWAMLARSLGETHDNGIEGPQATAWLQWIAPRPAATARLAADLVLLDAGPYWDEVRPAAVFDWDGEGAPELLLSMTAHRTDEDDATHFTAYTRAGGAVVAYPRAPSGVLGVADFDGDGRPDLRVPSGLSAENTCGLNGILYPGPERWARSMPDGTFSEADPAAVAFVRRQCEGLDLSGRLLSHDERRSALNVACARFMGVTAESLAARVRAEYPTRNEGAPEGERSDDACFSLETLLAEAATEPAFTVPRACE
ncbi:MAG: VCBS repeat-containing protein [Polyangiales bacterium]